MGRSRGRSVEERTSRGRTSDGRRGWKVRESPGTDEVGVPETCSTRGRTEREVVERNGSFGETGSCRVEEMTEESLREGLEEGQYTRRLGCVGTRLDL